MNSYGDLTTLKSDSYLSFESGDTSGDTYLRKLMESSSRLIDKYCTRHFYAKTATKYFDGAVPLFIDDLLSVTTFKTDEDGDATFENTLATTDYILYPLNSFPKTIIKLASDGDYGTFGYFKKGCEVIGLWGYGDGESATPYTTSGGTGTVATSTGTALTLSSSNLVIAGQTILCETEQMYVESVTTTTATVKRGVNGTTGVAHSTATIYIYDYPEPITTACYITTMRHWKRKDSAFQDMVGVPELGTVITAKGLDPDVKDIIGVYNRLRI